VAELIKAGKIREINDMRDETDLSGLKLAIDLKRGTDPDKLMQKLFKLTPLEDSFPCNFNILVAGNPRVMGVREILDEWTAWRMECVRRRIYFDLAKKKDKLHLLKGLEKILLDIDKAIAIIRETELEADVVPNLMMGFGIDQIQAEYVAEIKLRNINREYILKRTDETDSLENEIEELESILNNRRKIKGIIIDELKQIIKKYPSPRKTGIIYASEIEEFNEEEHIEDYGVTLFLSKEGYFKKITAQSLRMSSEQKYKEGDELNVSFEATNRGELLFLTDRQQIYKAKVSDFEDVKASVLGVYLPSKLQMDEGESIITMIDPGDYSKNLLLIFENGKAARIDMAAYATKTNRRKLINAYSDKSPIVAVMVINEEMDIACYSSDDRVLVFNTSQLQVKTSRSTQGVAVMTLKAKRVLTRALPVKDTTITNISRYRVKNIPAAGALLKSEDRVEQQLSLMD
jgi:DNA gyrase subunit A